MIKRKSYPRYFIGNNNWTITKYVYINKPNGDVGSILKENDNRSMLDLKERDCNTHVKQGIWKEITGAELVLLFDL